MPNGCVGTGNYVVKPGDCMASIAFEHKFLWDTLWNLPENSEVKRIRKDPYVLLPGDQVYIPPLRSKEQSCATDQLHKFVLKGVPERLRIVITDDQDQPVTNQPYVLEIDKKTTFRGETDGTGLIDHPIAPNARKGHLVVGEGDERREYFLKLGHVDPIDQLTGVQARLHNLGYYDGNVDGVMNAQTRSALVLFQEKYQLSPTGENDAPTLAKLKELFQC